jgi:hypothetical protein
MDNQPWFRISSPVCVAIRPDDGRRGASELDTGRLRAHTDRARMAVSRLGWDQGELRDALRAILDAFGGIEAEVDRLARVIHLDNEGVQLKPTPVRLGADGITVPGTSFWREGTAVVVYLDIDSHGAARILTVHGTIVRGEAETTEIVFDRIRTDQRDAIVAWTFQQQQKERRVARDTTPPAPVR